MVHGGRFPIWLNWSLFLLAAASICPGHGLRAFGRRSKLLCQLAWAWPTLSRWLPCDEGVLLRRHVEANPQRLGVLVWPYIHSAWTAKRRVAVQADHLWVVQHHLPWLRLGAGDRLVILSLSHLAPGLRLELDRASWFQREGELVFNVFLDDHRLMSMAFALARRHGELIAYVGGFQGSGRADALGTYRELTRTFNGLRPRDFTLRAFQLFAGAVGVSRLLCVADEYRHHRHSYFGSGVTGKLHLNYDEVWMENGGRRLASGFFQLDAKPAAKPVEEEPVRKRAMYRRRRRMMAELEGALKREVERIRVVAGQPAGLGPVGQVEEPSPEAA